MPPEERADAWTRWVNEGRKGPASGFFTNEMRVRTGREWDDGKNLHVEVICAIPKPVCDDLTDAMAAKLGRQIVGTATDRAQTWRILLQAEVDRVHGRLHAQKIGGIEWSGDEIFAWGSPPHSARVCAPTAAEAENTCTVVVNPRGACRFTDANDIEGAAYFVEHGKYKVWHNLVVDCTKIPHKPEAQVVATCVGEYVRMPDGRVMLVFAHGGVSDEFNWVYARPAPESEMAKIGGYKVNRAVPLAERNKHGAIVEGDFGGEDPSATPLGHLVKE